MKPLMCNKKYFFRFIWIVPVIIDVYSHDFDLQLLKIFKKFDTILKSLMQATKQFHTILNF